MAESDTAVRFPVRRRSWLARTLRAIESPFYRYRNARRIHSVRVGLAMLTSILATSGIHIPHGIWASVTLLVVIGGLQHQGLIRRKALERALGTLLGAMIGLTLIVVEALSGSPATTYVLMSIVAAICGYYAIGKPGYIALLTGITMVIVAGHGDNLIDTGLWRTLNVMIGIVIALAFSFALPLYATYSWRYRLADNLRGCARLYAQAMSGGPLDADTHTETFRQLSERLVQLRALMPSVAKEIDVPQWQLEQIQRLHRSMLTALEMLSGAQGEDTQQPVRLAVSARVAAVRAMLLATARALRFGGERRTWSAADALRSPPLAGWPDASGDACVEGDAGSGVGASGGVSVHPGADPRAGTTTMQSAADVLREPAGQPAGPLTPEREGRWWLAQRFGEQVDELRALLLAIEPKWNIERSHGHWPQ
jgi:uncharacterized membrane protein YccC